MPFNGFTFFAQYIAAGQSLLVFDAGACIALTGSRAGEATALQRFLDQRNNRHSESLNHNVMLVSSPDLCTI